MSLEALYGEIETAFGRVKNKIVSGVQPDTNDIEAVVAFVAAQMVRTSKFRDGWDMSVPNNASIDAIRDSPLRMAIETTMATLTTNGPQLLSFFALPEAIKRLAAMRATFLKTDDGVGFVTSDSPCCVVLYKNQSGNAFRYLEASTTNVLMPLGPSVAVILDHSPEPHEMRAVTSDHPKIHEINALLWSGAIERIVLPHKAVRPEWFSDGVTARLSRYRVV